MPEPNEADLYSIVTTTRAKYFGKVTKTENNTIIESAYEIPSGQDSDPQSTARGYLKGRLYGDNKRIELSGTLVESVTDATDETRILRSYEALLPDAQKRAQGIMTFKAFEDLLNKK